MKAYELVNCWPHLQPFNFEGRAHDIDCPEDGAVVVLWEDANARITELEHELEMLVHPMDLAKFRANKDQPK